MSELKSMTLPELTETLRAMLSPLGYSLPDAGGFSLQKVLDAAKGKPEALMGLLNQVMGSPEGAQAVEGLKKKTQK